MKRAAVLAVLLVLTIGLVTPAEAGGWRGGCCWGGWWWPGAFFGGLALGAAVAAPYAYPYAYSYPYTYPYYYAPLVYAPPAVVYSAPPSYAPAPAPQVQREVAFPNGKYVLLGDGVAQPWQWVWVPAAPPVPGATSPAPSVRRPDSIQAPNYRSPSPQRPSTDPRI